MKKIYWLLLLVSLLLLLAGCQDPTESGSSDSGSEETNQEGEASEGGTLTITDLSEGQSLDPHVVTDAASMRYIENMYNTLFKYEKGTYGEIEGDLVEDYEVSDDGTVYTLTLHDGVTFHNGDALTSEDVKYSIERIIENEVRAAQFESLESIETPDDTTVVLTLAEPVAPFLTFLAYPMNAIVNKTIVDENGGDLAGADAGSGPFTLGEWTKDQEMVLEKYEDYFKDGLPYLDKVVWRSIPDETARTTAIRNGEIDILLQTQPKDVQVLEQADNVNVETVAGTYWEYVGLNTEAGPLSDPKVRQAIAWAVDRDAVNDVVKLGQATPLRSGPIPDNHWAHLEDAVYPEQDLDKARQLLEEAGVSDLSLTMKVSTNQAQIDAAQVIKQQLQEVGVTVEVVSQEDSVFFDALGNGDFEMTVVGWVGFVDPDEFLYNIFHTDGMYNQQAYSNPDVDALLEQGRKEMDKEKRTEIYAEAQRMIAEDAPMVFLYANPQTSALSDRVSGFDVHPTVTTISLEETKVDQ
ncbi:ABC transporter substrate-binding protein [Halobacillus sp. ACCC02827]|uniref:ABC transporter substrate-binding protein n=1 Tax=unclassified Halobacillus TaxID=2636472 RepID=UPI0002A505C6|nr:MULTISPECIES: ABC transporter substrate-binding protein [unclassified Halobacillus]ELK47787.1 family 5 extracellular solute-binding protein [Halobacillus sp. BAB-2008]WJE16267.1 ABC transporter substrate-binding protein [Halobacillus sp. ACCC02827]